MPTKTVTYNNFTIEDEEHAKKQYENRCPECGRICLAENLENHISKHQVSEREKVLARNFEVAGRLGFAGLVVLAVVVVVGSF